MIAVTHFDSDDADFAAQAGEVLQLLAARDGYRGGTLGRSTDDARHWVLVTTWADVGSYRRAFGADVRMRAIPLFAAARDLPSAFEPLIEIGAQGAVTERRSDRY